MTKLFPNSPGNYYNHKPTSGYDQKKTITITGLTKIPLNTQSYFSIPQETITIIGPARIPLNTQSYFSIPQETITIIGPARIIPKINLLKLFTASLSSLPG